MGLAFAIGECVGAVAMWLIAFNGYRTTGPMTTPVKVWLVIPGVGVAAVLLLNAVVELFDLGRLTEALLILLATAVFFSLIAWFFWGGVRREGQPLPGQRVGH